MRKRTPRARAEKSLSRRGLASRIFTACAVRIGTTGMSRSSGSVSATGARSARTSHARVASRMSDDQAEIRPGDDAGDAYFAAVIDTVNAFRDKPAGHLRLTVPRLVGSFFLAPLIARFHARYPDVVLEISVDAHPVDIIANRRAVPHAKRGADGGIADQPLKAALVIAPQAAVRPADLPISSRSAPPDDAVDSR